MFHRITLCDNQNNKRWYLSDGDNTFLWAIFNKIAPKQTHSLDLHSLSTYGSCDLRLDFRRRIADQHSQYKPT